MASRHGIEYLPSISTWEDIKKFISTNKDSLEYLKQYEGLDHFLGSGQYGKVFKIKGEELALKVTTDPYELEVSKKLKGHSLLTFIEMYFVKVLESGHGIKVSELLYPLNSSQSKFVKDVHDIHFFQLDDNNLKEYNEVQEFLKSHPMKIESTYLLQALEEAKKVGLTGREFVELDLNPGNFLRDKKGNIKICDL